LLHQETRSFKPLQRIIDEVMTAHFDTTDWALIAEACSPSLGNRTDAIGRIFASYREPIRSWFRRRGVSVARAEELAQDFLAKSLIERRLLDSADPRKGRLRTLLKCAAERFMIDELRRGAAHRRAAEAAAAHQPTVPDAPDDFDLEWVRQQLQLAVERCRARMEASGQTREWQVLEASIINPIVFGGERPSMAEVASKLGLPSAAVASNFLFQAKKRVQMMFHEVVSETVGASGDYQRELQYLDSLLRGSSSGRR
jgi:DNA-directed RNA polymerase specialized sigma24 family protein